MKIKYRACVICNVFFKENLLSAHMAATHGSIVDAPLKLLMNKRHVGVKVTPTKTNEGRVRKVVVTTIAETLTTHRNWKAEKGAAAANQENRARNQARLNQATEHFVAANAVKKSNALPFANGWEKYRDVLKAAKTAANERKLQAFHDQMGKNLLEQEAARRAYRKKEVAFKATVLKKQSVRHDLNVKSAARKKLLAIPKVSLPSKISNTLSGFVPPVTVDCSCGGTNENCFRCAGIGYYAAPMGKVNTLLGLKKASPVQLGSYASDSRGGTYSIRENGRFSSLSSFDSFDDESDSS